RRCAGCLGARSRTRRGTRPGRRRARRETGSTARAVISHHPPSAESGHSRMAPPRLMTSDVLLDDPAGQERHVFVVVGCQAPELPVVLRGQLESDRSELRSGCRPDGLLHSLLGHESRLPATVMVSTERLPRTAPSLPPSIGPISYDRNRDIPLTALR